MAKRAATVFLTTFLFSGVALAADQPGQKFLLKPSDLPKPYATPAVAHNSNVIPRGNAMPQAPKGFKVTIFATGLTAARFMAVAPNGDVFLSERLQPGKSKKVTLLRDSKGAGVADQRFTFADGLINPSGVAVHQGYVYISDQNALWRTPYVAGATKAGKLERVTRAKDLRLTSMHGTRNFAFGPGNALMLEMGSRDNVSDFRPGAEIFQVVNGELKPFASGLRNPVGIAFQPGTSNLYVSVNERDGLGDALAPDYFTLVKPGGFYGYPGAIPARFPIPTWARHGPTWWPSPSCRMCCFPRTAPRPEPSSIPATISPPSIKATLSCRCMVRGTAASPPATRWCAFRSRMAGP